MSLCDICTRPGRCCSGFTLNIGDDHQVHPLYILVRMVRAGVPFLPWYKAPKGYWRFWCPLLTEDGRCGEYNDRPFTCRHYQPLEDGLCAMYTNAITQRAFGERPLLT